MDKTFFTLTEDDTGRRFDRVIRKLLAKVPLSQLYAAIRKGKILINGKRVPLNYTTLCGDVLTIETALIQKQTTSGQHIYTVKEPPVIPHNLEILLKTPDLIAVNKPPGITVHGEASIESLIAQHTKSLSFKQGPLHRLDKYTSGIIFFSRSLRGAQWFSKCLKQQQFDKYYLGIAEGRIEQQIISTATENAAPCITECYPQAYNSAYAVSLVLFKLVTGKKHQIRKHLQHIGHPLAGDRQYGSIAMEKHPAICSIGTAYLKNQLCIPPYFLHAWRFHFPQDRLLNVPKYTEAPLQPVMKKYVKILFPHFIIENVNKNICTI